LHAADDLTLPLYLAQNHPHDFTKTLYFTARWLFGCIGGGVHFRDDIIETFIAALDAHHQAAVDLP
jgi:hypothetical protein